MSGRVSQASKQEYNLNLYYMLTGIVLSVLLTGVVQEGNMRRVRSDLGGGGQGKRQRRSAIVPDLERPVRK